MKLPPKAVEHELNQLLGRILEAADKVKAEFEQRTDVPQNMRAGQLHVINCIRHMPIGELHKKLTERS